MKWFQKKESSNKGNLPEYSTIFTTKEKKTPNQKPNQEEKFCLVCHMVRPSIPLISKAEPSSPQFNFSFSFFFSLMEESCSQVLIPTGSHTEITITHENHVRCLRKAGISEVIPQTDPQGSFSSFFFSTVSENILGEEQWSIWEGWVTYNWKKKRRSKGKKMAGKISTFYFHLIASFFFGFLPSSLSGVFCSLEGSTRDTSTSPPLWPKGEEGICVHIRLRIEKK